MQFRCVFTSLPGVFFINYAEVLLWKLLWMVLTRLLIYLATNPTPNFPYGLINNFIDARSSVMAKWLAHPKSCCIQDLCFQNNLSRKNPFIFFCPFTLCISLCLLPPHEPGTSCAVQWSVAPCQAVMYGSDLWAGGNRKHGHVGNQTAVSGEEAGSQQICICKNLLLWGK